MKFGKRVLGCILAVLIVLGTFPADAKASQTVDLADAFVSENHRGVDPAYTVYVSPNGSDSNSGGKEDPFKTMARARDAVRELDKTSGDIVVEFAGGFYPAEDTVVFDDRDSGNENCTIYYQAAEGEKPVISGGNKVTGTWEEATDVSWLTGGLKAYKTPLERDGKLRAIYVNGNRANMTLKEGVSGVTSPSTLNNYNITKGEAPWAWKGGSNIKAGNIFPASSGLKSDTRNAQNIELNAKVSAKWVWPLACVASVEPDGNNNTRVNFQMPYTALSQTMSWGTAYSATNTQRIYNVFEFLGRRGDFYFDEADSTLYYIPLAGEDMGAAEVVVPQTETIVDIRGRTPMSQYAQYLTFSGLSFNHSDWNLLKVGDSTGYSTVQGCTVFTAYSDGNWHNDIYRSYDVPPSAIQVNTAKHIRVLDGEIGLTGFGGIHLENDVYDCEVTGNFVNRTGSTGIIIGHPQHVYVNDTADIIVKNSSTGIEKEKFPAGTEAVPKNILVTNNYLFENCFMFPDSNPITSFYTYNMQVLHNFIYRAPYGGMSIGWGWCNFDGDSGSQLPGKPTTTSRNNRVSYNRVEDICLMLDDSGGIYSLGQQGNNDWTEQTEMNYNYINGRREKYTGSGWINGFHPDEGSKFINFKGNVITNIVRNLYELNNFARKSDMNVSEGFADRNNGDTSAPRITYDSFVSAERIWPQKGHDIVLNSGIEDQYKFMIQKSVISAADLELASNISTTANVTLNRGGLLAAEDEVWIAPAGTTVFAEGEKMTKAAGNVKTIKTPAQPGEYKLFIKYASGEIETASYTIYSGVDVAEVANVKENTNYDVSKAKPLKLELNTAYTYTLNGKAITNGYLITTADKWELIAKNGDFTVPIKFTTSVSEANRLLTDNVMVIPGGGQTVRLAYDLNDPTKTIWLAPSGQSGLVEGPTITKAAGDSITIVAPEAAGEYVLNVVDKDGNILSQSSAFVIVAPLATVPTVGLDLWLNAETGVQTDANGVVTGWKNQAAGAFADKVLVPTLPATGTQPANSPTLKKDSTKGYSYVYFDTNDKPLKTTGFKDYNGKTAMTIFTLAYPETAKDASADQNGMVFLNDAGWGGISLGAGTTGVSARFGTGLSSDQGGGTSRSATVTGLTSIMARKDGTSQALYLNGVMQGAADTKAAAMSGVGTTLGVGYTMAETTPKRFKGRIAQVLIYDKALTTEEIAQVEKYFTQVATGAGIPNTAVDKTLLNALLAKAEKIDTSIYTAASLDTLDGALSAASAAAVNPQAVQQEVDNAYYALRGAVQGLVKLPSGQATAMFGTPVIGGAEIDPIWDTTDTIAVLNHLTMQDGPVYGTGKVLWDAENLYVLMRVKDPVLNSSSSNNHEKDSVEIFVDESNSKATTYGTGMGQYRINYLNGQSFNPTSISEGVTSFAKIVEGGYIIEAKIPFKTLQPQNDHVVGFDLQINDASAAAKRQDVVTWTDTSGNSWQNGSKWGIVTLYGQVIVVDKDALSELIAEIKLLNKTDYTATSWEALQSVLAQAEAVFADEAATEEGVKAVEEALQAAKEALVGAGDAQVLKDYVQVIWNSYQEQESNYTPATWAALKAAVDQAFAYAEKLDELTVTEYEKAVEDLDTAISGLISQNKNALGQWLDMAKALLATAKETGAYFTEAVENLESEIALAQAVYDNAEATQDNVDAAWKNLQKAMQEMLEKGNLRMLEQLVALAKKLTSDLYTQESWSAFQTELVKAEALVTAGEAVQEDIEQAYQALLDAMLGLAVKVNVAELEKAIALGEEILSNSANYVPATIAGLQEAVAKAKALLESPQLTQTGVNEECAALILKLGNARLKADKTSLAVLMTKANQLKADAYSAKSFEIFQQAYGIAKYILEDEAATQEQVDASEVQLQNAIQQLQPKEDETQTHAKYINGYQDGTFRPDAKMSRAEVATMFYNLLENKDGTATKRFQDIPSKSWYTEAVNALAQQGVIDGYADGTFRPTQTITRAEFVTMAVRFAKTQTVKAEIKFKDVPKNQWYFETISSAVGNGWIEGYADNTFRPNQTITRAEAVKITNAALGRKADNAYIGAHKAELNPFKDLRTGHWAFSEIIEASVDHSFTLENNTEKWIEK